jgi:hypothetical protein
MHKDKLTKEQWVDIAKKCTTIEMDIESIRELMCGTVGSSSKAMESIRRISKCLISMRSSLESSMFDSHTMRDTEIFYGAHSAMKAIGIDEINIITNMPIDSAGHIISEYGKRYSPYKLSKYLADNSQKCKNITSLIKEEIRMAFEDDIYWLVKRGYISKDGYFMLKITDKFHDLHVIE